MKRKLLPLLAATLFTSLLLAQKAEKTKSITGYAITAPQKGQTSWKEVRLVDISTGDELRPIYRSTDQVDILNARTGKPVVKRESNSTTASARKVVNLDDELERKDGVPGNTPVLSINATQLKRLKENGLTNLAMAKNEWRSFYDKPFGTNSAACAYDKKHERLYYTPMSINQLRYIDLKSKTPRIYYFEDEPFGFVTGLGDVENQIPRMVIASDGNGYALSNDANHLMRFTTDKNATISDLGALTDDANNANYSVHNRAGYGGDMIADASGNLYLVTGNRNVFKISIATKVATYQGTIQGLPQGFTTNGAMVEEGSKVIVCSSQSTVGYYRFDLVTMQAEKISSGETVFNASDLANGNLAFEKAKKDKKEKRREQVVVEPKNQETTDVAAQHQAVQPDVISKSNIAIYPNPVTTGIIKLRFTDQPAGRYQVQFLDINGQLISKKDIIIHNHRQVEEFRLPSFATKGTYVVNVISDSNKISYTEKINVE
jgi:type IX secretion system substrate protein